ncbi:MAG: substrate-binding domain-containing protein [Caldimonas sp.]
MTGAALTLHFLCAGAAQGLVKALEARFRTEAGANLEGRYGAVGAMKEALLAGEPCDVMIVTAAMIDALAVEGRLDGASAAALGRVRTGVAVRDGDAVPAVDTPDGLRAALLAADRIYFPDPVRATAGIHFAAVLKRLGVHDELAGRFATFPNGATAMRELGRSTDAAPIGCTQVTEINYTEGVRLAGALPTEFELATVYTAAASKTAGDPALAARFVALLTGAASRPLRLEGGFEFEASGPR